MTIVHLLLLIQIVVSLCSQQGLMLTDFILGPVYLYELGYDGDNSIFNLLTIPGNQTLNVSTIPDYCESFYIGEPNMYFACSSGIWMAEMFHAPKLYYREPRGCKKVHFYKEVRALCANTVITL